MAWMESTPNSLSGGSSDGRLRCITAPPKRIFPDLHENPAFRSTLLPSISNAPIWRPTPSIPFPALRFNAYWAAKSLLCCLPPIMVETVCRPMPCLAPQNSTGISAESMRCRGGSSIFARWWRYRAVTWIFPLSPANEGLKYPLAVQNWLKGISHCACN